MLPALWLVVLAGGAASAQTYVIDAERSSLLVNVGRAGLFAFAGHRHEVLASRVEGTITADAEELSRSSVTLRFPAAGLRVTGKGEPDDDVPKVQAKMEGPDVLDVARFPDILFRSSAVEGRQAGGVWNLRLTGELSLKGVARSLVLPLRVRIADGLLEATGQAVLRQTDFGLRPVSVAGLVKVKNELGLDYRIVGRLTP